MRHAKEKQFTLYKHKTTKTIHLFWWGVFLKTIFWNRNKKEIHIYGAWMLMLLLLLKRFLLLQNFPQLKMNARYMRVTQTIIKYYRTTKKAEKKKVPKLMFRLLQFTFISFPHCFESMFFLCVRRVGLIAWSDRWLTIIHKVFGKPDLIAGRGYHMLYIHLLMLTKKYRRLFFSLVRIACTFDYQKRTASEKSIFGWHKNQ